MSKKTNDKAEVRVEGVEHALTAAEQFLEKYQKQIFIIIGIIIGTVLLYLGFQHLLVNRKSSEAAAQMFPAEQYFQNGSWEQALDGDGNNLGFIDIISEYRFTPSANLAKYYAGMAYLRMGEYEKSIEYLKKFKSSDRILSNLAFGAMGDAYAEQGDSIQAVKLYLKAADHKSNDFTSPMFLLRAGILFEKQGDYKKAEEVYARIKKEYATSTEGRMIDKYITRVQIKGKQ